MLYENTLCQTPARFGRLPSGSLVPRQIYLRKLSEAKQLGFLLCENVLPRAQRRFAAGANRPRFRKHICRGTPCPLALRDSFLNNIRTTRVSLMYLIFCRKKGELTMSSQLGCPMIGQAVGAGGSAAGASSALCGCFGFSAFGSGRSHIDHGSICVEWPRFAKA